MKKELKILLLTSVLFFLAGGLLGPIYAVFVQEIGGDLLTAGTAYSIFAIATGILIYLISKIENRMKHIEVFVTLGYGIKSIGFLGYLLITSPIHLFIVQIIMGIGEAILTPAYDGLYTKHIQKGKTVYEWGVWESLTWITVGIAAIIGGFVAKVYGFQVLFVFMLIASVLGTISSSALLIKKHQNL